MMKFILLLLISFPALANDVLTCQFNENANFSITQDKVSCPFPGFKDKFPWGAIGYDLVHKQYVFGCYNYAADNNNVIVIQWVDDSQNAVPLACFKPAPPTKQPEPTL